MKRDVDLARQLLLDIENRGADCSVSVLRSGPNHEAEERVRYHLRLLIDAGLLKEIDRTAGGVPCVRLTDAGHEIVELSRSESRWREAKQECHQRTGGVSLIVVRGILVQWALDGAVVSELPASPLRRRADGAGGRAVSRSPLALSVRHVLRGRTRAARRRRPLCPRAARVSARLARQRRGTGDRADDGG